MNYIKKNRNFITSSKLKSWLDCQYKYKLNFIDEIELEPSSGMELGLLIHELCHLGWSNMNKKYYFCAKGERSNSKSLADEDRELISYSDGEKILKVWDEIKRQEILDFNGDYEKEYVVEHGDLRCTLDRINIEKGIIRDFKIISKLDRFEEDYYHELGYNYKFQASFYCYVCKLKFGKDFRFIFDVISTSGASCSFEVDTQEFNETIIDIFRITKKFEGKMFRDQCLGCPYYNHCDQTAIQKEFIKI